MSALDRIRSLWRENEQNEVKPLGDGRWLCPVTSQERAELLGDPGFVMLVESRLVEYQSIAYDGMPAPPGYWMTYGRLHLVDADVAQG